MSYNTYKIGNKIVISQENDGLVLTGKEFSSSPLSGSFSNSKSTIDCSLGNYFKVTVTGTTSWEIINVPQNCLYIFVLELVNGGLGDQIWFKNVKWNGNIKPTLTSSGTDILVFFTDNSGINWYGSLSQKNIS